MTSSPMEMQRVVITGLGVITCLGSDLEAFWSALLEGRSGVRQVTLFDASDLPCRIAGEVPEFDSSGFIPAKHARRMSRAAQMALVAAIKAYDDSGLPAQLPSPELTGVSFGTAVGGFEKAEKGISDYRDKGYARMNPFLIPSVLSNMLAFHVTARFGAKGPSQTTTTACAAGTQSIGSAADAIRLGRADVMLAGGAEAMLHDYTMAGFCAMRALPVNYNDRPKEASRPFDGKREGFVFSEGAACLVLESLEHALARNAQIYAEIIGHASSSDGYHVAALDPSAEGALLVMKAALDDAGIAPEAVGYVNAHGTSTMLNDSVETLALKKLLGDQAYKIPISSTKSMIGHAMGASGAIEAVVCALTLQRGIIHPTANYENQDPDCDLDYVPNQARDQQVDVVLSNSFGLGAQNACLLLKRMETQ